MSNELTTDWLQSRLTTNAGAANAADISRRGDHDLNPDMAVHSKLTAAAVLVPIVTRPEGLTTLFTKRTDHLAHHPGQISFPGGHVDAEDEGPIDTALRETEEEVGIDRRSIRIVGQLNEYVTRTGFSVTPIIGLLTPPFDINPDPFEVDHVFEVPLSFLMDPANHKRHGREHEGKRREFYAMPYGDYYIWGATAGMLKNLYDALYA